jgi:hypothetical protein
MKPVTQRKEPKIIVSRAFEDRLLVQENRQEESSLFAPEQRRPSNPLVNTRRDIEGRNVVVCKYPFYAEPPSQISNGASP